MNKNIADSFPELITAARDGSECARQQLFVDVRNYLLLISNQELDENLRRKMGPSDIVQQTCVNAVADLKQFRGATSHEFRGWLRSILLREIGRARNTFRTLKRDIGREENLHRNDSQAGLIHHGVDVELTPSSNAIEAEKLKALERGMQRLSAAHRQVIQLRNLELESFCSIARTMDRTEEAVRKLWQRAILQLNRELQGNSEFSQRKQDPSN